MYKIVYSTRYKKDFKRCKKRGFPIDILIKVLSVLAKKAELPATYRPHKLSGNYNGFWECHIKPNWLLIWKQDDSKNQIILERTGTHSDLFK